ncbi:MAG TPA: calcium-binding protein [Leptolyngbyaceae cyanobacterium]
MANIYGTSGNDTIKPGSISAGVTGGVPSSAADVIYGYAGNDILDGGLGADIMDGGDGNDTYYVDNVGDVVKEYYDDSIGGTADTVYSSVSYSLSPGTFYNQGHGIENLYLTGTANINATGNSKNNILKGNSGSNVLNGGLGADTMDGGDGNDTYYVDNVGDVVKEVYDDSLGGTADTVYASVSYSLSPGTPGNQGYGIENLYLTGSANINATGNSKNNILKGNSGSNVLNGGLGADTMDGGDGNDTYYVDNVGDVVKEYYDDSLGGTADTVYSSVSYSLSPGTFYNQGYGIENLYLTGSANINATGNSKNNILKGNSGSNVLTGGLGADTMDGGDGNDTYYVDNVGDIVKEVYDDSLGGTADTVYSSVSYSLSPGTAGSQGYGIENLYLTGSSNISATGNSKNNILKGNSGSNVLNGGAGADAMYGGAGNDTYYVDSMSDSVIEYSGEGIDTVISSVSTNIKWLPSNVENLTLSGSAYYGDGNDLSNVITGTSSANALYGYGGNDLLIGGGGADVLTGGLGADDFKFNYLSEGIDIIKDFSWQEGDQIVISAAGFGASSTNQFSYNSSTGALFYDPAGAVGPTQFATLENKPAGFSVSLDIVLV